MATTASKAKVIDRGRLGWAVDFRGDGAFLSAMPDEATARLCAASAKMNRLMLEIVNDASPCDIANNYAVRSSLIDAASNLLDETAVE